MEEDGVGWGTFLCVKFAIDLTNPIARDRTININGTRVWVGTVEI